MADVRTIGLVGYPNVGKSSTINAILQSKKVAVSATPGKTKHFQVRGYVQSYCDEVFFSPFPNDILYMDYCKMFSLFLIIEWYFFPLTLPDANFLFVIFL